MKSFDGYLKKKLGDSYVLLAGGGEKPLNQLFDYVNTNYDSNYNPNNLNTFTMWSAKGQSNLPNFSYGALLSFPYNIGDTAWNKQIYITNADSSNRGIYARWAYGSTWNDWVRIALVTDNVASATKLQTAKTLTIGSTGKTFDGTANVSWSLAEIGAAASAHDHNRLSRVSITSTDFAKANWSGFYNVSADGTTALPGANSGGNVAIHAAWDDGSNTAGLDMLINDNPNSNLYFRARVGGGDIGSWKTLLDSSNYTSYTVKKDGTGASGTWAINISGNATTSTTSKYPYGFGGYQQNNNWPGVSGNSIIVGWQDPQRGGEAVWLTNGSGQLSLAVDGFFYQGIDSRGNHRVVDTYDLASYYTKTESNANYVSNVSLNGNYLRVTKNGSNTDLTIPYSTNSYTTDRAKKILMTNQSSMNIWEGTSNYIGFYCYRGTATGCPSGYPYGYLQNYAYYDGNNTWSGQLYFTVSDFGSEIFTRGYHAGGGYWTSWRKFWHELNDGAGSGLDADLIDGIDSNRIVYGSNATKTTTSSYSYNSAFPSGFYTNNGQFALHCAYHGVGNVAGWTLYTADGTDVPLNFIVQNGAGGGHSYELISSKGGQTINGTLYLRYSTYPNLQLNNTGTECTMYFFNNSNHKWIVGSNPWGVGSTAFAIGDYDARFILYDDGTGKFTGNLYAPNFYTTSDRSKKKNISSFSEHIRKFQLKDTEKWHYGVIAQEVPEMFKDGEEGNMTVNYNSVLSYYIGQLENRVKELEDKLKKYEEIQNI